VQSTFASGLDEPQGLAFDSEGNLYEADYLGENIYKFTTNGVQSTFAFGLPDTTALAFQPIPTLEPLTVGSNGTFQLTVSIPSPYYSTIVQASTDLVNWVSIYTNTPPFSFSDPTVTASPYRFYRALVGP
jgi:hypothetical protein